MFWKNVWDLESYALSLGQNRAREPTEKTWVAPISNIPSELGQSNKRGHLGQVAREAEGSKRVPQILMLSHHFFT